MFRGTEKGQPAGSSILFEHDDEDDDELKSVSLGLVGRRHRLTAARAQQRPP